VTFRNHVGPLACAIALALSNGAGRAQAQELNLFGGLELFLDDEAISWTRNLRRELKQPAKYAGNPVVRSEFPWEREYTTIYGTVLWDPEKRVFRMWYNAFGADYRNQQFLAYAESADGLRWQKPLLDLVPFGKHEKTNILLGREVNVHGPCLIRNPEAPPGERYLLIFDSYTNRRPGSAESKVAGRAVYTATSPDGIHFTPRQGRLAVLGKSDTGQSLVWNPERGRFQAFLRGINEYADGELRQRVRYVRLAESPDGAQWGQPVELMKSDDADGAPDSQLHQLSVTRYGNIYVGLLTLFRISRLELGGESHGEKGLRLEHGTTDTQLITSRDGVHWNRVAGRQTFLPLGAPGQWDSGWIVTASELVAGDNEVRIYYGGSPGRFGGKTEIGVATFPLDRFAAMKPARLNAEAILELKPYWYRGDDLVLNASADKGGEIRVEVLDFDGNVIDGFEKSAFVPIRNDSLQYALRWRKDGQERRLPEVAKGAPVRLRFYLKNAEIYSLRFAGNTFGMGRR